MRDHIFAVGGPIHGERLAVDTRGHIHVPFNPPEYIVREYDEHSLNFNPKFWVLLYEPEHCRIGTPGSGLFMELTFLRWHRIDKQEAIRQACGLLFAHGVKLEGDSK